MASPANLGVRYVHRYRRINARVACDVDLVGRETGRPVDRVEERIGPVSLVSWFPDIPGYRPRFLSVSAAGSPVVGLL
ncbi:MAG TPA: hypothetical protein ENK60_04090 [Anaerolineae bacterium]|nr:hypothetical protein [Anaerolineae bacterium]